MRLLRRSGRRRFATQIGHGGGDLLGILGNERDGLTVGVNVLVSDGRRDGAELLGREARELRQLEIGGAELLQVTDDAIAFRPLRPRYLGQKSIQVSERLRKSFSSRMRRRHSASAAEQRLAIALNASRRPSISPNSNAA